jgi:hypothetical protein
MSGPKRGRIVERPIVRARRELRDALREASAVLRTAQTQQPSILKAHSACSTRCNEIERALEDGKLTGAQADAAWRTVSNSQQRRSAADMALTALDGEIARLADVVTGVANQSEPGLGLDQMRSLTAELHRKATMTRDAVKAADQINRRFSKLMDDASRHLQATDVSAPAVSGKACPQVATAARLIAQMESDLGGTPRPALAEARRTLERLARSSSGPSLERDASALCDRLIALQEELNDEAATAAADVAEARVMMSTLREEVAASGDDVCRWGGTPDAVAEVAAMLDSAAKVPESESKSLSDAARTVAGRWGEIRRVAAENKDRHARREQIANAIAQSLVERVYDEPVGRFERVVEGIEDPLSKLIIYAAHPSGKGDIRVHLGVDGQVQVEVGGVPDGEEEICRDLLAGIGAAAATEDLAFEVTDWGRAKLPESVGEATDAGSQPRERQQRERQERRRE